MHYESVVYLLTVLVGFCDASFTPTFYRTLERGYETCSEIRSRKEDIGGEDWIGDDDNDISFDESDFDKEVSDAVDSFLKGEGEAFEIDGNDIPVPREDQSPGETLEDALHALRNRPSDGTKIFLTKYCLPLKRSERMNGASNDFREIIRVSTTPKIFATNLRASPFGILLDWKNFSLIEGFSQVVSIAFVNVALFFEEGSSPSIVQFTLRKSGTIWLIDTATLSKQELFFDATLSNDSL